MAWGLKPEIEKHDRVWPYVIAGLGALADRLGKSSGKASELRTE